MITYKLTQSICGEQSVIKTDSNSSVMLIIPLSEDNRHYREYLEWLAEGNTPLPADE